MRNQKNRDIDTTLVSDESRFWDSFYAANSAEELGDWQTIGPSCCEPEIRFHYNATENSIIHALAKAFPYPPMRMLYPQFQKRRNWRVLDIGSGAGHWLDFYRRYYDADVTGVELTSQMAAMLSRKYPSVIQADITQHFSVEPVDIVNAIGVMFHICDDERWAQAVGNLASNLKPGGLMLIGGEFEDRTEDVQFHKTDDFESWREHDVTSAPANLVNKRVRSLALWTQTARSHGLDVVDVIRTNVPDEIRTPENNLLILEKASD